MRAILVAHQAAHPTTTRAASSAAQQAALAARDLHLPDPPGCGRSRPLAPVWAPACAGSQPV